MGSQAAPSPQPQGGGRFNLQASLKVLGTPPRAGGLHRPFNPPAPQYLPYSPFLPQPPSPALTTVCPIPPQSSMYYGQGENVGLQGQPGEGVGGHGVLMGGMSLIPSPLPSPPPPRTSPQYRTCPRCCPLARPQLPALGSAQLAPASLLSPDHSLRPGGRRSARLQQGGCSPAPAACLGTATRRALSPPGPAAAAEPQPCQGKAVPGAQLTQRVPQQKARHAAPKPLPCQTGLGGTAKGTARPAGTTGAPKSLPCILGVPGLLALLWGGHPVGLWPLSCRILTIKLCRATRVPQRSSPKHLLPRGVRSRSVPPPLKKTPHRIARRLGPTLTSPQIFEQFIVRGICTKTR